MKHVTIVNRTADSLWCRTGNSDGHQVLAASSSATTILPKHCSELTLGFHLPSEKAALANADWDVPANGFVVQFPMPLGAMWKVVKVADECPWRIYRSRTSRRHHTLLIIPRRELSSFLSDMPDSSPLSDLMLPGTHDTMAFYGWPISQCQSLDTPLSVQLQSGIRLLDIRLAVIKGHLVAYHGLYPQRASFQEILSTIHDFLTSPSTRHETIVMSIKQEDFAITPPPIFSQLVHDELVNGPGGKDMWFLENRVPLLGEVRGKVVMFSRFGGDGSGWEGGLEGIGIHPTAWPDSSKWGFTWQCKNTLVRTHDWYNIPSFLSIPEKTELATQVFLPPPNEPPFPILSISFFSAASFPLAFPPTIALGFGWPKLGLGVEGVNARAGKWFLDKLSANVTPADGQEDKRTHDAPRIRGWALFDFFKQPEDNAVIPLLVECNYLGRDGFDGRAN